MRLLLFALVMFFVFTSKTFAMNIGYIEYLCDADAGIFNVTEGSVDEHLGEQGKFPNRNWDDSIIILKSQDIEWNRGETIPGDINSEYVAPKQDRLKIPPCSLKALDYNRYTKTYEDTGIVRRFKIMRTKIETVKVRGMCGAAGGATFNVSVDDQEIVEYPSRKEQCFRGEAPIKTVNYQSKNDYITVCSPYDIDLSSNAPAVNVRYDGTFCKTGQFDQYLIRETATPEELTEDLQVSELRKIAASAQAGAQKKTGPLHSEIQRQRVEIQRLKRKQPRRRSSSNTSLKVDVDQYRAYRELLKTKDTEYDELKTKYDALIAEQEKSVWQRWFGKD